MEYYETAFGDAFAMHPVLVYYSGKSLEPRAFNRGQLQEAGLKAVTVLRENGIGRGDHFCLLFSQNRWEDIAFRVASLYVGAVPVTVNWQADTAERIKYKIELTLSRLAVFDPDTPEDHVAAAQGANGGTTCYNVAKLESELPASSDCAVVKEDDTRIVIFTSGTTGNPKGVMLPYRAYACNQLTFESFLEISDAVPVAALVANPLHHTNSTAITDWMLRRPGACMHLVERYTTQYWRLLSELSDASRSVEGRLVATQVARHYDFLADLSEGQRLPVDTKTLQRGLSGTDILIGSAPVGPTTVQRLQRFAGKLPHVRFGSTETCLQVLGTPMANDDVRLAAFERGWSHEWRGEPCPGYYIGRHHAPHTEVKIVRSVEKGNAEYMLPCDEGEAGQLITRGKHIMSGYVHNDTATEAALGHEGGWYTNLGDVCFYLSSGGAQDIYWQSRDSALLIRGGANYAYQQINEELCKWILEKFALAEGAVAVAVCGLRIRSEHEDECCVTVELNSPEAKAKASDIELALLGAKGSVSKAATPDHARVATIPRNFKGAVLVPELKATWTEILEA